MGSQYSWLSSLLYIAQLVFQPLSSFILVRFAVKYWVIFNLFGCEYTAYGWSGRAYSQRFLLCYAFKGVL
jgi:hypothetical protein